MLKKFLTIVLPIALPFLVYWGYVLVARWRARRTGGAERDIPWPWAVLTLVGVVLMVSILVGYRILGEQANPDQQIIPERYIDGEVRDSEVVDDQGSSRGGTPAGE
ncbi:hypothetical protein CKO28_12090 [Rhodovibrio sodomensis]|uniref:Cardiolipin synthase N-terminal domain-containing protein n=1 Tax=Rhodovibrio sodomensis TaxID=1088 RepID=A0ABS1DEC3_9PROT|nr:hypothetical protein [Rhodovibrio sodomensis]MBK1668770.1 hypothetical protein [Rhodovibrio sodomensis]